MKTIYVLCEGPTEQQFVHGLLYDIALEKGVCLQAPIVATKRSDRKYRGGVSSYGKIRKDIITLCRYSSAIVTSLFDLYALPKDTPGYTTQSKTHYEWAVNIERAINNDIGTHNVYFNLVIHEFEALLYADPSAFHDYSESVVAMMEKAMTASGGNPELINNSFDTSPSHRIIHAYPEYSKASTGVIISKKVGLDKMRAVCPHFNEWLSFLGF